MGCVSESIWSGKTITVPMAEVQHIEKLSNDRGPNGLWLITKHTKYNFEVDIWENPIYIPEEQAAGFMRAWCIYRSELESDTLMEHHPETVCPIHGDLGGGNSCPRC